MDVGSGAGIPFPGVAVFRLHDDAIVVDGKP